MRRSSFCIGCVAIVAAAILFSARFSQGEPPAAPTTRTVKFTYWVKVPAPAEGSKRLELWMPVPIEDDLQKVSDLKVEPATAKVETEPTYGNKMVHLVVENPKDVTSVSWTATVTRTADSGQGKGPNNPLFLAADRMIPLEGKATALAGELKVADKSKPVADRAKTIYDHVLSTMEYSKDDKVAPGWGKGDFNRACEVGKGNCTDFHAKFMGIARASGIPARFTMGISLPTDASGKGNGYHCWAHYLDGDHWVPVDISEAQKVVAKDAAKAAWFYGHLDADRIAMSVGRDVTLAPKQQGGPLYHFVFPYVEVDGKAVDVPKDARGFTFENVTK